MRLKTFSAPTMNEALREVREALGEDAIIVSTQRMNNGAGVRVTAALEASKDVIPLPNVLNLRAPPPLDEVIGSALKAHGTPERVADRLLHAVRDAGDTAPPTALAGALAVVFGFAPMPEAGADTPVALVGPPGAGKTITIAKLAARAALADRPVKVVTTDGFRAGGVDQLVAFTRLLEIDLHKALSIGELERVAKPDTPGELVLIDTAGVNPFNADEVKQLSALVSAVSAEPVLTLAAGGDAADAMEIGAVFSGIGADRMLITRLDAARRLGAILAAAEGGRLSFSNVSVSAHVARGFHVLEPGELARLLLCDPNQREFAYSFGEAPQ